MLNTILSQKEIEEIKSIVGLVFQGADFIALKEDCDYEYYSSSGVVLGVGGSWGGGVSAGLWYSSGSSGASNSNSGIGGRLVYRPFI